MLAVGQRRRRGGYGQVGELRANPIPEIKVPPYPNYHKNDELGKD